MTNANITFKTAVSLLFAAAVVIGLTTSSAYASRAEKVAICHLPPGNPENVQYIEVGSSAVETHMAHGDALGDSLDDCLFQDLTAIEASDAEGKPAVFSTAQIGIYNMRSIQAR